MNGTGHRVLARAAELASAGQRVLVVARGSDSQPLGDGDDAALPGPLEPLALLTFLEELRPEAQATVDGLRARGIDVKIVSGDDPNTVAAIGRRLGIGTDADAASGLDLAGLDDDALADVALRSTIFGRVDPHLKARLVTVLKGRGRYVAMTGDGVNDILPVRTADVGVAMQSGSPATRGVADLVLVRDDFSILPEAIRDGQRIVAAMAATLTVLLARTFYVLLIIVGASLLELPFPFTPRQNSILAFITVGVPIIVLALWVRPGPSRAGLLKQTLRISIPLSLGVVAVALPVYAVSLLNGASAEAARTILTTLASFLGIGALTLIPIAADERGRIRMPAWARVAGAGRVDGRPLSRRALDGARPVVLPARPAAVGDRRDAARDRCDLDGGRHRDPSHADRPARDRRPDRRLADCPPPRARDAGVSALSRPWARRPRSRGHPRGRRRHTDRPRRHHRPAGTPR